MTSLQLRSHCRRMQTAKALAFEIGFSYCEETMPAFVHLGSADNLAARILQQVEKQVKNRPGSKVALSLRARADSPKVLEAAEQVTR